MMPKILLLRSLVGLDCGFDFVKIMFRAFIVMASTLSPMRIHDKTLAIFLALLPIFLNLEVLSSIVLLILLTVLLQVNPIILLSCKGESLENVM